MKPQSAGMQSASFWNALERKSEEIENAFQESSRFLKCYVCTHHSPCIECQHCTMNTCRNCIVSCEGCRQAFCNLCALPKSVLFSSLLFSSLLDLLFSIFSSLLFSSRSSLLDLLFSSLLDLLDLKSTRLIFSLCFTSSYDQNTDRNLCIACLRSDRL